VASHSDEVTLLVVEDDVELCHSIAVAAQTWTVPFARGGKPWRFSRIIQATSLNEGLRGLELRPDVMVLDIRLEKASGMGLATIATRMTPAPLILVASGEASAAEAFALAQTGVRGYLAKPFDLVELRLAIEAVANAPPNLAQLAPGQVGAHPIHAVQDTLKRAMLLEALTRTRGNYVRVAELLGVTRQAVQQMVSRYDLTEIVAALRETIRHEN
jgi:DNA-binding NtrC family response regulator